MNLSLDWLTKLQAQKVNTGLDVGRRNIKCVHLKKKGKEVVLDEIFMLDLANGNAEFPTKRHVAEKLSAVVEVNHLKDKKVVACGGGSLVQTLDLKLAKMSKKELQLVLENNLKEILGRPLNEISYDYQIIEDGAEQMVRVFYSEISDVTELLNSVSAAKLLPARVTASYLATAEMLDFNGYTEPDKAYILVDMGESATSTSLILGQEVIANHSQPTGFDFINSTLMQEKNCSYEEAEVTKQYLTDLRAIDNQEVEALVDQSYMSVLEGVQNAIDYFREQELGVVISEIFLTGGGVAYGNPVQTLADHNGIKTTIVNPFRNIQTVKGADDPKLAERINAMVPFMATAVGLALSGVDW